MRWKGGRAVGLGAIVVFLIAGGGFLFGPLVGAGALFAGLLLLVAYLVIPPTWTCRQCGYRYASHAKPLGWRPTLMQEFSRLVTVLVLLGCLGTIAYFTVTEIEKSRAENAAVAKRKTDEKTNAPIVERNTKRQSDTLRDEKPSPVR